MKYLVETPGDFGLHDLMGGQTVKAHRPTVVTSTPFIERMFGTRLTKLEVLADDATDTDLQLAKNEAELEDAIADLPRAPKAAPKPTHTPAAKPAPQKK